MSENETPDSNVQRLPGGHPGKLHSADGEQWPVRVFERDQDELMLVLLFNADNGHSPDGDEIAAEHVEPLLLEYASGHGLVRFRGEAVLEDHDLVRFHAVEGPEVLQRREFVRVEASQPVMVATDEGPQVDAHTVDVSGGGLLLTGLDALEIDTPVRFKLHLHTGEAPIEGNARVVRTSADGKRGVVFEEISRQDRQRLIRFVFDRQRAALARTRGPIR
jgi:c-di-GMP-binding flagellar brake protein YcgR